MSEIPADNKYRQYLVSWHGRKAAYRSWDKDGRPGRHEHSPELFERVENLLKDRGATEEQYREIYEELEGIKPIKSTSKGGRPEDYREAVGAVKVLGKIRWKDRYQRCKDAGIRVHDTLKNFTRYMQKELKKPSQTK